MNALGRIFGIKPSMVVIEDSEEARLLLDTFFGSQGYRVALATDGVEGVERVRAVRPDIVLLDFSLPKLSGTGVLMQLKADPKTRDIPVLMCTTNSQLGAVEKCCEIGAVGYILKPLDLTKALEKVQSVLKIRR